MPKTIAVLVAVAVLALAGPSPAVRAEAQALSSVDARLLDEALEAADKDKWSKAREIAARLKDPVAAKIVRWLDYARGAADVSFDAIAGFLDANPAWPQPLLLQRRAEEAMPPSISDQAALAWFARRSPVSADGFIRYGAALMNTGDEEKGRAVLRDAWVKGNFGAIQEKQFLALYRRHLGREDHIERLNRLLWEDRHATARRMLWKIKGPERDLYEVRLLLAKREGNVDKAISRLPEDLRKDPGLIYDRLRWRRRKGKDEEARELLFDLPADGVIYPERLWQERAILARMALRKGHITEAYRIAKEHRLVNGSGFAEGEWLAGWIALRFLHDNDVALGHFKAMHTTVVSPISRARAAYWAGRATEAMGNAKEAEEWYRAAAYHPTTYYGQLAAAQIHPDRVLRLPPPHVASAEERREFGRHEVVRAVRILHQVGAKDHLKPFVLRLAELPDGPAWPTLVGELVDSLHRPELAVLTAKRANRFGYEMLHSGYPTVPAPPADDRGKGRRLEAGLINAVVRQESAFNPVAVSVAGARGLMQLLPETAKKVASGINLRFSKDRLTGDPEYNLRLGQAYLADLVDEFAGSYVLALAAYNAGPSRARQWMRENGDPRDRSVDVVDWIEMIPFEETRNYVQRVLEALQVYRLRSSGREVAMGLPGDLTR